MATLLADGGTVARAAMRCWGDFALSDAVTGAELKPRGRKARAVLAYLATHPGKRIGRERLMGLLWGERGEEQARGSLRQSLFELRSLANGRGLLTVDREAVTLNPDALVTDIDTLERLSAAGDYEELLVALPDGDETLFANLDGLDPGFDDWLQIERTRRSDALASLIDAAARAADAGPDPAVARALRLRLAEIAPGPLEAQPQPRANPVGVLAFAPAGRAAADPSSARSWPAVAAALLIAVAPVAIAGFALRPQAASSPAEASGTGVRELYAAAHAEIREREESKLAAAESLLRRAVVIDPGFAPAWVSLGSVVAMRNRTTEGLAEAERHVRRALALAPGSAEAHGALGMVLGFETPEARAAIKKAAALDPNNAEIQFWLSNVYANEGDFGRWVAALQRAAAIDPTWHRATGAAAMATWEMGYGEQALVYRERLRRVNFSAAFNCEYAEDWLKGDYSTIIKETIAARPKLDASASADFKLGFALLTLGQLDQARLLLKLTEDVWQIASGAGPTSAGFRDLHAQAGRDRLASEFLPTAVGQLLNAGRAAEIVRVVDDRDGVLGAVADDGASAGDVLTHGVNVALALRAVGRSDDGEVLLRRVEGAVDRSLKLGPVPTWFHAAVAQLWAARGDRDRALAALGTAIDRGWHYNPRTPLPDIAEVPAFRPLRGDVRFERLRGRLRSELERERREAALLTI